MTTNKDLPPLPVQAPSLCGVGRTTYSADEMRAYARQAVAEAAAPAQPQRATQMTTTQKLYMEEAVMVPAATAPAEQNQCDGCMRGLPISGGFHRAAVPVAQSEPATEWTITSPDGRTWTGPTAARAAFAAQRDTIDPRVLLQRISDGLNEPEAAAVPAGFNEFWEQAVAANGGASIGADYRHWARRGFVAALAAAPTAPAVQVPPMLTNEQIKATWLEKAELVSVLGFARDIEAERDKQWLAACGVRS